MVFRRCSIGGKVYRGDDDAEGEVVLLDQKSSKSVQDLLPPSVHQSPSHASVDKAPPTGDSARTEKPLGGEHFHDTALATDIATAATADKPGERNRLNGFFTVLALCHTVLAAVDPHTGALDYKAQSPDEAALVQAAADVGFEFRGRDKDVLFLKTPFEPEVVRFRLLNILEFTSARKRMSVIVRRLAGGDENREEEVGELMLLSKGADNVIFERLAPGAERLKAETEAQLDEFAREGLRTLTLACRTVDAGEYAAWSARYADATAAIDDREELVERVSEEIEGGLVLLGATAIEDRLQDGVPEAIADLKKAGIKIWVATGDKLETAIGAWARPVSCAVPVLMRFRRLCSYRTQHEPDWPRVEYHHHSRARGPGAVDICADAARGRGVLSEEWSFRRSAGHHGRTRGGDVVPPQLATDVSAAAR